MRELVCLILLLASTAVAAQVYKWVDEKGVVHYTDQPPNKTAAPVKLPPLQTYKGGTLPSLDSYAKTESARSQSGAAAKGVKILSPTADETFRSDSEQKIPVSVQVSPSLADDQKLVYYLNGAAQGAPSASMSYTFTNVDRGSHTISVALVNGAGKELARSATVTVNMKLATVQKASPPPPPPPKNR